SITHPWTPSPGRRRRRACRVRALFGPHVWGEGDTAMAGAVVDVDVADGRASRPFRLGHRAELDGLRGVAVVLVVVYHLNTMWPDLGRALLPGGYLGVDLFLVLSGFLITSLLIGEHQAT